LEDLLLPGAQLVHGSAFLERVFPIYRFDRRESNICSLALPGVAKEENPLDIEHLFDMMMARHEHLFDQVSVTPGS
jgi:hypothetical protein